jgi:hypothetical protein
MATRFCPQCKRPLPLLRLWTRSLLKSPVCDGCGAALETTRTLRWALLTVVVAVTADALIGGTKWWSWAAVLAASILVVDAVMWSREGLRVRDKTAQQGIGPDGQARG